MEERRENGIYWKDQKDDMDGVVIPTPYLQQFFLHNSDSHWVDTSSHIDRQFDMRHIDQFPKEANFTFDC